MKQTNSTINTDSTIVRAQDAVDANLAKFESALALLADRVEHTSQRVEHVGELARKSKEELMHLKETAQVALDPFLPVFKQGKDISSKAVVTAKENPKPFLWAFAGLIGAYLAFRSYNSRQPAQSYTSNQDVYTNNNYSTTGAPI